MFTRKLRAAALVAGTVLAGAVGVLAPVSAWAATGAHAAAATAAAVKPADTVVNSGWFGLKTTDGYCLDSNAAGSVYLNPCQVPGNKYQDWNWTEWEVPSGNGWTYYYSLQDQATGRCLDSNAAGQVYTNPCQAPGNQYQGWYWWNTSQTNVENFQDVATSRLLWGATPSSSVRTATQSPYNDWNIFQ